MLPQAGYPADRMEKQQTTFELYSKDLKVFPSGHCRHSVALNVLRMHLTAGGGLWQQKTKIYSLISATSVRCRDVWCCLWITRITRGMSTGYPILGNIEIQLVWREYWTTISCSVDYHTGIRMEVAHQMTVHYCLGHES